SRSGARFDYDKALWFNSQYLQALDNEQLAALIYPLLVRNYGDVDEHMLPEYCGLFKERAQVLDDLVEQGRYVFEDPKQYDQAFVNKKWSAEMAGHFSDLHGRLQLLGTFGHEDLEGVIKPLIQERNLRFGDVLQLLRCCVSGSPKGPDVFRMLTLLGRDTVLQRLSTSIERFNQVIAMDQHG
ncbi:MAG: hypothetical protein R3330_16560, partial [Saprospiraceae bacterium]|nr:hypothetical protein [Saprospiraceae bacterium]